MIFWKKQQSVINRISAYLDQVDECGKLFRSCVAELIEHLDSASSSARVEEVHKAESRADDLRRAVELELYQRSLIPESRGDVLGLLETLDTIPGVFQSVVYQLLLEHIVIPPQFRERYLHLVDVNLQAYGAVRRAALSLFYSKVEGREVAEQVDRLESESDRLERALIRDIFASEDLDKADKILLKEIVVNTGDISDNAESVKDRLILAIAKRKI